MTPGTGTRNLFKRIAVALAVLVLVAVGLTTWLAFFTDTCEIRNVLITGNRKLAVDYVRQLSGVDSYRNLLTLPVGRVARNLELEPWVKEARVGRRLLNTVTIDVIERSPMALLDTGGSWFLLDGTGFVIAGVSADQFPGLPRIHGGDTPPPRIAERITDKEIADCVTVMSSMPAGLRKTLTLGNPFDGRGQVFATSMGFNIIYGEAMELREKNEVLEAIISEVHKNNRSIAYVDVRVPGSPVTKPE